MNAQAGIRFRSCLVAGDMEGAQQAVKELDQPHLVELLLGAALLDGRGDFEVARRWVEIEENGGDFSELCSLLLGEPDTRLSDQAAGWVVQFRLGESWVPEGRAPTGEQDLEGLIRQLKEGAGGLALLEFFKNSPLYKPIYAYYRLGSIHALGFRPLLLLALYAAQQDSVSSDVR
jgi:hypothetical protein